MRMKSNIFIKAILCAVMVAAIIGCSKAFVSEKELIISDASLQEEGKTLAPGDAIHLLGEGYRQTDNVMLSFSWETGDKLIPVGKASGVYAEIVSVEPGGVEVLLPYRYPAARVDVTLTREGKTQEIGSLNITDGQAPKDLRLYGIKDKSVDGYILDENGLGRKNFTADLSGNIHSVVNVPRSFGLCGLTEEDGNRGAVFLNFFTGKTEHLSGNAIALSRTPTNMIAALCCRDNVCTFNNLPVEVCADYMTKSSGTPAPVQPKYDLPEGLKPEYFGDYPGTYSEKEGIYSYLFSANEGNGKWATVILRKESLRKIEELDAAAVIPFWVGQDAGYIITFEGGPSLFRVVNAETGEMDQPIYTYKSVRVLSANVHTDRPDHILLNIASGNATKIQDLDWKTKTLSPVSLPENYKEVLMAN